MRVVVELRKEEMESYKNAMRLGLGNSAMRKITNGTPLPKGLIPINDAMSVFDDFMCGDVEEDGTETFYEMLKERVIEADMEGAEE